MNYKVLWLSIALVYPAALIYRYDKTKIVTFKGTWVEIIINVGVVLFNLIKSIIVYLITLLVYKKLSTIIHHHTGD